MSYVWQRWIPAELQAAGVKVVEVQGWQNRGRPASTGQFSPTHGNVNHHTAGHSSASNPHPSLNICISGRSDLPGPLCHVLTAYDGTVYVIAAGRANHAGRSDKTTAGVPSGTDGNSVWLGNEIDTDGTQTMPAAQREAAAKVNAVFMAHHKNDVTHIIRHQDLTTRKWDIGSITTLQLRADAKAAAKPPTPPEEDMPLNDADKAWIRGAIQLALDPLLGDHVAVDPSDPDYNPDNKTIYLISAVQRLLKRSIPKADK